MTRGRDGMGVNGNEQGDGFMRDSLGVMDKLFKLDMAKENK